MSNAEGPPRWSEEGADFPLDFETSLLEYREQGPNLVARESILRGVLASESSAGLSASATRKLVLSVLAGLGVALVFGLAVRRPETVMPPASKPSKAADIVVAPEHVPAPETAPLVDAPGAVRESPDAPHPSRKQSAARARVAGAGGSGRAPSIVSAAQAVAPAEDEFSLLLRAHRVLPSDPAQALALTQQHRARYPRGALTEERDLLAIESEVRLGHRAQASALARAFAQTHPGSAHWERIRVLLETSEAASDAPR